MSNNDETIEKETRNGERSRDDVSVTSVSHRRKGFMQVSCRVRHKRRAQEAEEAIAELEEQVLIAEDTKESKGPV